MPVRSSESALVCHAVGAAPDVLTGIDVSIFSVSVFQPVS